MRSTGVTGELVVLVHGMGRTRFSMHAMARALRRNGYDILNWGFSSTRFSVSELAEQLASSVQDRSTDYARVHFVGHSLGTVLIRMVLARQTSWTPGRVVMLAPPNQGSRSADRYARWLGWLLTPLPELRTYASSLARTVPLRAGVEAGIIAAKYDGKVAVAETRLDGIDAHIVVPAIHTFLMSRRDVQRLTIDFLRTGSFEPS